MGNGKCENQAIKNKIMKGEATLNDSVFDHYKTNLQRCTVGYTGIYACGVSYKRW